MFEKKLPGKSRQNRPKRNLPKQKESQLTRNVLGNSVKE